MADKFENQQRRVSQFSTRAINEDNRTVEVSFSSEAPVGRGFGIEILDHSPEAVNLERLARGGPVLLNHNHNCLIGVVDAVTLDTGARKGRAIVRLGRSDAGEKAFQDVKDGILCNVSVGYTIEDFKRESGTDGKPDTIRATKWTPYEISFVSVPADTSVGVGRSINFENTEDNNKVKDRVVSDDVKNERARVAGIESAFSQARGIPAELKQRAIETGMSEMEFRAAAFEAILPMQIDTPDMPVEIMRANAAMAKKNGRRYSLLNVIRSLSGDRHVDIGFEVETSQEMAYQGNRSASDGLLVPLSVLGGTRTFTASSNTGIIPEQHLAGQFIESLRAHSIAMRLGCTFMGGLVGNVTIPKATGNIISGWLNLDDTDTIEESEPTTGNITLAMKSLSALVPISHAVLKQSAPSAENLVRTDLIRTLATDLDKAVVNGSGEGSEPTGILNTTGINTVTLSDTTGKVPTYTECVNMFGAVADCNADAQTLAYLVGPTIASALMRTPIESGTNAQMVWENSEEGGQGKVAGQRAYYSKSVPSKTTIFGGFSDVIIGQWGNSIELEVDRAYRFAKGTIAVRAIMDTDIAVRHAESFCIGV